MASTTNQFFHFHNIVLLMVAVAVFGSTLLGSAVASENLIGTVITGMVLFSILGSEQNDLLEDRIDYTKTRMTAYTAMLIGVTIATCFSLAVSVAATAITGVPA